MKPEFKPATVSPYRPLPVKHYAGLSAKDRQTQRRDRMIEAAIELYGTAGYADTKIRHICEAAGCASRTFYEEFGTREVLLKIIYRRIVDRLLESTFAAVAGATTPAEGVAAAARAYVAAITSDVREARIMLLEVLGVKELNNNRHAAQTAFAKHIAMAAIRLKYTFEPQDFEMLSIGLIGAADMIATAWVLSRGKLNAKRMSDTLITIWTRSLQIE